jgi:hypothetical protein
MELGYSGPTHIRTGYSLAFLTYKLDVKGLCTIALLCWLTAQTVRIIHNDLIIFISLLTIFQIPILVIVDMISIYE